MAIEILPKVAPGQEGHAERAAVVAELATVVGGSVALLAAVS